MLYALFRRCLTKISLLLIIISISTFPLPLAAQVKNTNSISHKDLLPDRENLPRFDARMLRKPRSSKSGIEQKKRALALRTTTPDKVVLRWDDRMDLPHNLHAYGAPLSLASNDDPATIARRFALENRSVFEVTPSQLDASRVSAFSKDERVGITRLVLEQRIGGIRVFDSEMMFVIDRKGRVLSQSGSFIPEASFQSLTATASLTSQQALRRASEFCKMSLTSPLATALDNTEARQRVLISSAELASPTEVSLVYYPITRDEVRLAYQVLLYSRVKITDSYFVLIDAQTGRMLRREPLTKSMQAAQGRVFTKESPLLGDRELVTLSGDATASPEGWVTGNRTEGNNTQTIYNPSLSGGKPTKANSDGSFDFPLDLSVGVSPIRSSKASTTNLFYWINLCHDRFYSLGFTETWRNFQKNNFGRGGLGNDAVRAETLRGAKLNPNNTDGLVRNNAFFSPTLEGETPMIAMLMWEDIFGSRPGRLDSSYDAGVIIHEYTHGVSTRLTGTDTTFGLRNLQGAGMGEGWSDFFGASFVDSGTRPLDASTPVGVYVTGSPEGIRAFPYSTKLDVNPLALGNIAFNPAVHFQGTVWCSMLWDLRQSLIARYGFEDGRRRAEQLVIDGLKITPTTPLFTDARDALIIADETTSNGADLDLIWRAFARRGLGAFASSGDDPIEFDLNVEENFEVPPQFTAGMFLINEKSSGLTLVGKSLPLVVVDRDKIGVNEVTVNARNQRTGDEVAVKLALAESAGRFAGSLGTVMPGQGGSPQSIVAVPGDVISITYANERNESGAAEIIEARTTAARRVVVYEDNFDQTFFDWEKSVSPSRGPNFWHVTQHRAASLPNSISFSKEKRDKMFAPRSSAGLLFSPTIEGENFIEPELELDYVFNGYPGDLFELSDEVIVLGSGISGGSFQFSIVPSDDTSFQSVTISMKPLEKSPLFLLAFFYFASDARVNREDFESIFIDNIRITALSAQ